MAIVQIGQTSFSAGHAFTKGIKKRKFIMDSDADAANLPTCDPGSTAFSADGTATYVVNASGAWVKTTRASGTVTISNDDLGNVTIDTN